MQAFQTQWFSIEAVADSNSEKNTAPYYVMHSSDGVIILPILDDGRFLLVEQYRHARKKKTLEFPAGQIDRGETPEQAARRELREETCWETETLHYLGCGGLALNRESAKQHFFLAKGLSPLDNTQAEPGVSVRITTSEELKHHAKIGVFEQTAALGALLMATWKVETAQHLPKGILQCLP